MNQLMTDLFDLACMQVLDTTFHCEVSENETYFTAFSNQSDIALHLHKKDHQIFMTSGPETLHFNQYPLYERYFEFLERGV